MLIEGASSAPYSPGPLIRHVDTGPGSVSYVRNDVFHISFSIPVTEFTVPPGFLVGLFLARGPTAYHKRTNAFKKTASLCAGQCSSSTTALIAINCATGQG